MRVDTVGENEHTMAQDSLATPEHPLECMWVCIDPGNGSSSETHAKFIRFLAQQPESDVRLFNLECKTNGWCGGGYGYGIRTNQQQLLDQLKTRFHCRAMEPTMFFGGIESRADLHAILKRVEEYEEREANRKAEWAAREDARKRKRDAEDTVFAASKDPKLREVRVNREDALKPHVPHDWRCGVSVHRFKSDLDTPRTLSFPVLPPELCDFLDSVVQRARAMPSHTRDALAYVIYCPAAPGLLVCGLSMLQCAASKWICEALDGHGVRVRADVEWTGREPTVSLVATVWRK